MIGAMIGGTPPVDPDEARRTADDILSDAAYDEPTQSLLDRAFEWILDRLDSVVESLPGGGPGTGVAWIFVVALLALAGFFVFRALRAPSIRRDDDEPGMHYGTETSRDADLWLDEAERLAAAGDHRGALRCRHQALVARLVTEGVVADVPGRTAGEYASAAGSVLADQVATLRSITDRFDGAWYGGERVDVAAYSSFVAECESVEATVHETAEVPA